MTYQGFIEVSLRFIGYVSAMASAGNFCDHFRVVERKGGAYYHSLIASLDGYKNEFGYTNILLAIVNAVP
jgi:hypothetical protein